ncbi:MAG TPA: 2'-5' RNA ligase family protein [Verrucomicrobiae bacterium]
MAAFLSRLRRLEPDQYYYTASEVHITVLSLFTATIDHGPFFAQRARYVSAADTALRKAGPMRIDFAGVTASTGTVMIQGFFVDDVLNDLRDALRRELRARGLGAGLDQRYRLRTAHMTAVRFRSPLRDSRRFAAALEQARERPFGATTIRSLSLVENDWYMSHHATEIVKRYPLVPAR